MAAELARSLSQQADALHAEVSALQATHASLQAAVHDAQAQLARVGALQADAGVGSDVSHRLGREREEVEARVEALQAQHLGVQVGGVLGAGVGGWGMKGSLPILGTRRGGGRMKGMLGKSAFRSEKAEMGRSG